MMVSGYHGAMAIGAVTVAVGIAAMIGGGAPSHFVAINGVALVIAIGLAAALWWWPRGSSDNWIMPLALIALVATLVIGPDIDGVRRWLAVGPLTLHIGMLVVPTLAIGVARAGPRLAAATIGLAAFVAALQPDLATAIAVLLVSLVCSIFSGGPLRWAATAAAAVALLWCLAFSQDLPPVRFVEHVVADAAARSGWLAGALLAVLLGTVAAPLVGWRSVGRAAQAACAACAASLAAYVLASLIGPYPTPMIGAGAAAILGWGLALGRLYAPVGTRQSRR